MKLWCCHEAPRAWLLLESNTGAMDLTDVALGGSPVAINFRPLHQPKLVAQTVDSSSGCYSLCQLSFFVYSMCFFPTQKKSQWLSWRGLCKWNVLLSLKKIRSTWEIDVSEVAVGISRFVHIHFGANWAQFLDTISHVCSVIKTNCGIRPLGERKKRRDKE